MYFNGRFVLSTTSPLITLLLQEFHDTQSGGHAGIKRTLVCLETNFFWPGMRQSVINYISHCPIFQQIKSATTVLAGLLQSLPIPEAVWEDITMDFIIALPVSRGTSSILIVVDRLSKYIHIGALLANFTALRWLSYLWRLSSNTTVFLNQSFRIVIQFLLALFGDVYLNFAALNYP